MNDPADPPQTVPPQPVTSHAGAAASVDLGACVSIVLVGPESSGNVGAAARALKTMGLRQLVLVAPQCDPFSSEAKALAHNAEDVLAGAIVLPTLDEALRDTVFSVATTQRARRQGQPTLPPEEAASQVLRYGRGAKAAIVFGRESSGLTNRESELCSVLSTAPSATFLPALNLAQAVMLYVYSLYRANLAPGEGLYEWQPATHAETERFFAHLTETLIRLDAHPATTMESLVAKFRRVFGRAPLETRDVLLLHRLLSLVDRYVEKHP